MTDTKKKLLVIVGAGASAHLEIPGTKQVGELLRQACLERYPLVSNPKSSIYHWLASEIENYRRAIPKPDLVETPNFEELLYTVLLLSTVSPDGFHTSSLGAFVGMRNTPEVFLFGQAKSLRGYDWTQLGSFLADTIIDHFRQVCRSLETTKADKIGELRQFFAKLAQCHNVAIVTLNYDDAIWRVLPTLETGFDPSDGRFDERRLFERRDWGCFIHLHGSVHFDMQIRGLDLHQIVWKQDLAGSFAQNAAGRGQAVTTEGVLFPQSVIVAGYGKTQQILRRPFRTYYSELDRLVSGSDALLCLGYGFADLHLNGALGAYRDSRNRPVVLVNWADDHEMTAAHAEWGTTSSSSILAALATFVNTPRLMSLGQPVPTTVAEVKRANDFDLSTEKTKPLAIWYGGMEEACRHPDAILDQLKSE
jgi:SIR2-like domain